MSARFRGGALLALLVASTGAGCKRAPSAEPHEHPDNPALSASVAANKSTRITVELGEQRASVDLATLPKTTFGDQPAVAMTTIWEAAKLGPLAGLDFDFEGDDGFKPTSKPKCPRPLPAEKVAKAVVVVQTRGLEWPDAPDVPRCWSVKLTKRITAIQH